MSEHRFDYHVSHGSKSSLYLPKCLPCRWIGGDHKSLESAREEFDRQHVGGEQYAQGDPDHWARSTVSRPQNDRSPPPPKRRRA
jgi:hypothetical protein